MRNGNTEQQTTERVAQSIPSAPETLCRYGIGPAAHVSLGVAAAGASAAPDELLAVLEYRARHQARRRPIEQHELAYEL